MVGASLGCLCLIPLLYMFDGPSLIFLVFSFACLAASGFAIVEKRKRAPFMWLAMMVVGVCLFYVDQQKELLSITKIKSYMLGEFQTAEEPKVFEKWSPVSRVAVFGPVFGGRDLVLTSDGGAPTLLRKFDGNYSKIAERKTDCRQIGQRLSSGGNVLVIGSAGGTDVLMSLALGKEKITAVDINPVTADLVKGRYSNYIGNIFHDPRVTLHVQDGRNFVASTKENYDLIHLTMVDSWTGASAGAFVFNENTLYTKEAIKEFTQHLNPNGILSITRYSYWSEGLRLVNTLVESLEESGIKNYSQRLLVVLEKDKDFPRVTILLKNGVYSATELKSFSNLTQDCGGAVVFASNVITNLDDLNWASQNIRRFLAIAENAQARSEFVGSYDKNIEACTDDKPFFFFTTKFSNLVGDPQEHAARRYSILSLFILLGVALCYSVVMAFITAKNLKKQDSAPTKKFSIWYFALVGAGFMIIEISFTQKLTALLGHPAWSFLAALTSFLFSSACGSYFSKNAKSLQKILATVVLIIFIYQGFLYDQMNSWMALSLWMKFVLAIVFIFPLGFFMGMCFPMGIRLLVRNRPEGTAAAWALNGAFSVVGSVTAIAVAIFLGFKATLVVGGTLYLVAIAMVWNSRLDSSGKLFVK